MASIADLDLLLRSEVSAPLSATLHDARLTAIEDKINAVIAALNTVSTNTETYGEMYQAANTTATTISVANTWYQVTNFSAGHMANVTMGSNVLILPTAGDYQVTGLVSLAAGAGEEIEVGIGVSGTVDPNHIARSGLESTSLVTIPVQGIVEATAAQTISLWIKNVGEVTNITVREATIAVRKIH